MCCLISSHVIAFCSVNGISLHFKFLSMFSTVLSIICWICSQNYYVCTLHMQYPNFNFAINYTYRTHFQRLIPCTSIIKVKLCLIFFLSRFIECPNTDFSGFVNFVKCFLFPIFCASGWSFLNLRFSFFVVHLFFIIFIPW